MRGLDRTASDSSVLGCESSCPAGSAVLLVMAYPAILPSRQAVGREEQGSGKFNDEYAGLLGRNRGPGALRGPLSGAGKPRLVSGWLYLLFRKERD